MVNVTTAPRWLREPGPGVVELDGADLRGLCPDRLRERVALAAGSDLFAGTVAQNVRVGRPHLTPAEVREALQTVGLLGDVHELPAGLDTPLPPGGGPLAADLARAGHSVLLLEAGADYADDPIYRGPDTAVAATNDPRTRWDFFVRHADDPARDRNYDHLTWRAANGSFYVGRDPPPGAEQLGIVSN